MKELARITETFTESVIREMTRICDDLGGYNLSQGFPDFESPKAIKLAAIKAIAEDYNQYPVTFGEPELREAVARKAGSYNKIQCDADTMVTVTCGATEAMIATLKAIINPGDEIIVFEPFYENYGPDGILSGAIPRYVTLYAPEWKYNMDELRAAFNNKTKAIVINTPNNPTGKVFSRAELQEIAELCRKWDAYVITDEIYEHILYDGAEHVSMASLEGMAERTITINGASKTYSVTGWRIGWAIASPAITERIRKVHDFLTVGAPTPLQLAVAQAIDEFDESYYTGLITHYTKAREYIYGALAGIGFDVIKPQGAYYYLATIPQELMEKYGAKNDFEFAVNMIKKTKVASVPGQSFYMGEGKGTNQVRFCYCKNWDTLKTVRKLLEDASR